jgi:hypothetical protein
MPRGSFIDGAVASLASFDDGLVLRHMSQDILARLRLFRSQFKIGKVVREALNENLERDSASSVVADVRGLSTGGGRGKRGTELL